MRLNRDDLIADLQVRIKAWRNMEFAAHAERDDRKARDHRIRAETFEQLVNDLREQPITVVNR